VYDDTERKIEDLCLWLPRHIADVVEDDLANGRRTVVLAEDWHTAWPLIAIHDELLRRGVRDSATLAWTANNRFGFDRIDFAKLADAATLLTISRAMKHLMWQSGVNPLVVPNGMPEEMLAVPPTVEREVVRTAFHGRPVFAKVGRWALDKRWVMALGAVAELRDRGEAAVLLARGWNGTAEASAHYRELRAHADALGLTWTTCDDVGANESEMADALASAAPIDAGVIEITCPVAGRQLQTLYAAADAVLANSGFEPFGLVGVEAMAAGSIVVTGATGEDYLVPFHNGFALDTDDPTEIVRCLDWLRRHPEREWAMRTAARETACRYRWVDVIERLALALDLVSTSAPA
jgi:glycosyltransferase involved in cell wall biosynthesis